MDRREGDVCKHEAKDRGRGSARSGGKERRYPLRAVYKDAANPHPCGRRAAGEVDMFISLRNLLGLRYREAREEEREKEERRKTERNEPKEATQSAIGAELSMIPGARPRVPKRSLAVVGTSLRNVGAVFAD